MKCMIQPTAEEIERARQQNIRANDKHFYYADRLLRISLHENAGFGYSRLADFDAQAYEIGRGYISRYGEDDKNELDYAVDSYYAIRRDLRDMCGWDPETELWSNDTFAQYKPDENTGRIRRMHRDRLGYSNGIGFYVRQQLSMGAVYLASRRGFAGIRLNRVLHPVRDGYCGMIRQFLRCSEAGDREVGRMYKDVLDRFNALGYFEREND